jgi:hypothetical protein
VSREPSETLDLERVGGILEDKHLVCRVESSRAEVSANESGEGLGGFICTRNRPFSPGSLVVAASLVLHQQEACALRVIRLCVFSKAGFALHGLPSRDWALLEEQQKIPLLDTVVVFFLFLFIFFFGDPANRPA